MTAIKKGTEYRVIWKPYPSYDGWIDEIVTTRAGEEGVKGILMFQGEVTHNQMEIKSITKTHECATVGCTANHNHTDVYLDIAN